MSLGCVDDDDGQDVDGWTVRRTRGNQTDECGPAADFRRLNESLCVQDLQTTFTAIYWCETSSGQKSDEVIISVSGKVSCFFSSFFHSCSGHLRAIQYQDHL